MTACELYIKFRMEIETMYAPYVLAECDEVIRIEDNGSVVGLLCVKDKYIQGLYILPEHRRKGYGRKAIYDYIDNYGMLTDLTILNTNIVAKEFWESIFELEPIKENSIDTYYKIKALKKTEDNLGDKNKAEELLKRYEEILPEYVGMQL